MNSLIIRAIPLLLALAAIGGVIFMADSRTGRSWSVEPAWPYVQPAHEHWFYRTFATLPTQDKRLGIWGWAAHAWVYTRTIPATRETSAEFALLDMGPDGYYRKRYLQALTDEPPEYFAVIVGPNQFRFNDRATQGPQSLPGLQPFLDGNYQSVLDDGDAEVLIRRDVLAKCCQQGRVGPAGEASATEPGWLRFGQSTPGDLRDGLWLLDTPPRPARLLAIPIRLGPNAAHGSVQAGIMQGNGALAGCEPAIAATVPGGMSICIIEQPAGDSWRIGGRSTGDGDGAWIEVGRPFLTLAPANGG